MRELHFRSQIRQWLSIKQNQVRDRFILKTNSQTEQGRGKHFIFIGKMEQIFNNFKIKLDGYAQMVTSYFKLSHTHFQFTCNDTSQIWITSYQWFCWGSKMKWWSMFSCTNPVKLEMLTLGQLSSYIGTFSQSLKSAKCQLDGHELQFRSQIR